MHIVYVSQKSLTSALRGLHRKAVAAWKKSGSVGHKPKAYETADVVIKIGLSHIASLSDARKEDAK